MSKVSVVIIAKNEELKIRDCLESVKGWSDDIIVADDCSSDKTLEIAQEYTNRIYTKKMEVEGIYRNWAHSLAAYNWILLLDADERMTNELKKEIDNVLKNNPKFNGYDIPRKNYIGKYWVRYGGWYPSSQLKLFRKDKFKFEEAEIHMRAFMEGETGHLKGDIVHYSYNDFGDFLNKLNRQTTLEAKKWIRTKRKMSLFRAAWRTADRFFRSYLYKKAYKDGFMGFMVAFFSSLYQIVSYAKFRQMKLGQNECLKLYS
ncbi:MAG: glycosyltransferase family 2 protein [Patescibacteria group bacterium]